MYSISTVAFGARFTVSVSNIGIVITQGLSPVTGRDVEEFILHFATAFEKPIDQVRKELEPLTTQINDLIG